MEESTNHDKIENVPAHTVATIKGALIWTVIYFAVSFLMVSLLSNNFKQSIFQEDFIVPDIALVANFFFVIYYWKICLSQKKE